MCIRDSWWEIIEKKDDGTQKYHLFTKEIGQEPAYLSLFASFINNADEMAQSYKDTYGKDLEFCQIQLNYLDYKFQHAKEKVELIKQYGLPVWVMEPLRGGKLATVDDKYAAELTALRPDESVPGWGFRFLQSIPEVTMVLSGMSNLQQLADNIRIFLSLIHI